jgi:Carboxypeptidase regulatory-like domain
LFEYLYSPHTIQDPIVSFIQSIYNKSGRVTEETMRLSRILVLILLFLGAFACPTASYAKDKDASGSGRLLSGRVLDRQDNPLPDAVVYLSDARSRAVKTYIVGQNGAYDFPALAPNVDYEVYAQYHGRKSDTKTVSQFDDRKQVNIILRIDPK